MRGESGRLVGEGSRASMWSMMEELFPLYRSLCGPGFLDSLTRLNSRLPLSISEFASGTEVLGWTIPNEFHVREAWVEDESGRRIIDYERHCYHVPLYSGSFDGVLDREELVRRIECHTRLPDAIPLRQFYYRDQWGLCASRETVDALPPGRYRVHVATEHRPGHLRIGEHLIPGDDNREILINTYLCHPRGANDNLSSVVVAIELFRLLRRMPKLRYTYRLALWPESIGAITYIAAHPDRIAKTVGGYCLMMVGDAWPVSYTPTFRGGSAFDRAARHALKINNWPDQFLPYSRWTGGSDSGHFDGVGLRLPFGTFTRGGPVLDRYPAYHSSADDLALVRPEYLLETLQTVLDAVLILERNVTWKGNYVVDPFLTKHGIFPYQHGAGGGRHGNQIARAYFELMGSVDGTMDLLEIADRYGMSVFDFDEAVAALAGTGLITKVDPHFDPFRRD
ncbi:MAG: DUF4910 domain-containing protein [Alphaproteobacteria bacterium]|nr:DUF4910 domain-containing protein [Alphaproteobacteria bacterium]